MQRRTFLISSVAALATASTVAHAAPSSELWGRWLAHDAGSGARIDHSAWDSLLSRHLSRANDGISRFNYGSATNDRAALQGYIGTLETTAVSGLARPEQMAFWINLYNAVTVAVVLDHYLSLIHI